MSFSIIIPVYNEEKTLNELICQLKKIDDKTEIIIINDGSTDKTGSILGKHKFFKSIHNPKNIGKGFSIISGIKYAKNENIILMDGDLEISLRCIPDIINQFNSKQKYILVGSRWKKEIETGWNINKLGNIFINYVFNILYNTNLNDVLCCVKVLNRNLINKLDLKSDGFSIEIEIMAKLALMNQNFYEFDIDYKRRKNSEGKKLKISNGWEIMWKMLELRFKD